MKDVMTIWYVVIFFGALSYIFSSISSLLSGCFVFAIIVFGALFFGEELLPKQTAEDAKKESHSK